MVPAPGPSRPDSIKTTRFGHKSRISGAASRTSRGFWATPARPAVGQGVPEDPGRVLPRGRHRGGFRLAIVPRDSRAAGILSRAGVGERPVLEADLIPVDDDEGAGRSL